MSNVLFNSTSRLALRVGFLDHPLRFIPLVLAMTV